MNPGDPGPIYRETMLGLLSGSVPVEPSNTWSNIIFFVIAVYIALKTRLNYRWYPLIVFSLPVLLIGWVGGTMYHGTRSHAIWLILDFVPILILTAAAAVAYWRSLCGNVWVALLCFLSVAGSGRVVGRLLGLERSVGISIGYASMALAVVIPLTLVVRRAKWQSVHLLVGCVSSFVVAVTCRVLDRHAGTELPMGTHFLWHIFGGVSVWCLMVLTMKLNDNNRDSAESASG